MHQPAYQLRGIPLLRTRVNEGTLWNACDSHERPSGAYLASDELPMLIDLASDQPFHRCGYLLDRPCRAQHLVRSQCHRLGLAFQVSASDKRQHWQPIHFLEHFGPFPIWQIKVDYDASWLLLVRLQDSLCLG